MGAHLRRPRFQHPRGPKTLPRPKRGRVPRTRASVEGGKPNPPERWPLTNSRVSPIINPRAWKVDSPKFGRFVCALAHILLRSTYCSLAKEYVAFVMWPA